MVLYLGLIIATAIVVSAINIIIGNGSVFYIIGIVLVSILYEVLIDALFAVVSNKIPKQVLMDKKFFNVSKREQNFYVRLKIRLWKDKVWELGKLGGFSKSKIENYNSVEYADRFLYESYKGEVDHILGATIGFSVLIFTPRKIIFSIGVPVCCVNLLLNALSFMVLRYNTPKLKTLRKRAIMLSNKEELKDNIEKEIKYYEN